MPLIMEHDLDDLFGDAHSLSLPRPLPRGLAQRVDDLRLGGCRQYVPHPASSVVPHGLKSSAEE